MSEKDKQIQVIGVNLKHLRKFKNLTQQELADELGIRRSSIGAYEECRATPKYDTLEKISDFFKISIDHLVKEDLTQYTQEELNSPATKTVDISGKSLRVLNTTSDSAGRSNIDFVPMKASAGYLNGFADPEYIEELPKFQIPTLRGGTYRAFEIKGDSMLPLKSGTIIIGDYVDDWRGIKEGETYVIVSGSEGVVYKRVFNRAPGTENHSLVLRSDNPAYPEFEIPMVDVREVWKARMYMSDEFPTPDISLEKLSSMVMDLQQQVIKMKEK
ncbi:MAG: LexA family transcriptional regulator [Bacteroidia bacterium]|nr:LexA family transcriptional regulator [Bacteroidia bacterium]